MVNVNVRVNKSARGSVNFEYINKILDELKNEPAYALSKIDDNKEDIGLHVGVALEELYGEDIFSQEDVMAVTYGEFLSVLHENMKQTPEEIEKDINENERRGRDLYYVIKSLHWLKNQSRILQKMWDVNYGVFRAIAYEKHLNQMPEKARENVLSFFSYRMSEPVDETFGEVVSKLSNRTGAHWIPGLVDIREYMNKVNETYSSIYTDVFLLLYWICGKKLLSASEYKTILENRKTDKVKV